MPAKAKTAEAKSKPEAPRSKVYLVFGDDDFLVSARAKQLVDSLVDKAAGEFGLETVEGRADNAAQAVACIKRVDEALNTLAFFGGGKTVWLRNANFLGGSRPGDAKDVLAQLEVLADLLKSGLPQGYSLVVSATEIDKRRAFYKTMDKLGEVIELATKKDWGKVDTAKLEEFAMAQARANGKSIREDALQMLIELTGGSYRSVASELEKMSNFVGDRSEITREDVAAVGSASAEAVVWDLGDAIGDRDLSKALKVLDRLLFQGEKEIGVLFALTQRVRMMLLVRDLIERKLLQPSEEFPRFKFSLQRAIDQAGGELTPDRRFNPLLQHPYAVYKTALQARRYTVTELLRAMELLLDANKRLVSSSLDGKIVLEQTLVAIVGPLAPAAPL